MGSAALPYAIRQTVPLFRIMFLTFLADQQNVGLRGLTHHRGIRCDRKSHRNQNILNQSDKQTVPLLCGPS